MHTGDPGGGTTVRQTVVVVVHHCAGAQHQNTPASQMVCCDSPAIRNARTTDFCFQIVMFLLLLLFVYKTELVPSFSFVHFDNVTKYMSNKFFSEIYFFFSIARFVGE